MPAPSRLCPTVLTHPGLVTIHVQQAAKIAVEQSDQRCSPSRHFRHVTRPVGASVYRTAARFEDDDPDVIEYPQGRLQPDAHLRPTQSAEPAAERRDGDGTDAARPDLFCERPQAGLDVHHPALAPPVAFGREIDDVARGQHSRLEDEHTPRLHFLAPASGSVGLEVFGKRTFELKRDTAPHDADAVDGVDQSVGFLREDVAGPVFDHGCSPFVFSSTTVR